MGKSHVPFSQDNVVLAAREGVARQYNYPHIVLSSHDDMIVVSNKDTGKMFQIVVEEVDNTVDE